MVALVGSGHVIAADRKTVCTITVNSPEERDVFQKYLPKDDFDFVELVERGRPDWLASACRAGVKCDLLLISGHFDGGTEFYTDRLDAREFLPVDEMEKVGCSASCPGLFSQLKEVYLFGCNTLNGEPMRSASAEIGRSLVRAGHSPADADQLARLLAERHGESNRDRMRHIFKDVPIIYGFSSKAPLGKSAGPMLERYFQAGAAAEIGSGRPSAKLLNLFAPVSMLAVAGVTDGDPRAGFRRDTCQFADDGLAPAQKLGHLHALLQRDMAEVRLFLDHIEKYSATLDAPTRHTPDVAAALEGIGRDASARNRYLEFARDADDPAVRVRMVELARNLGWLSPADQHVEVMRMFGEQIARSSVTAAEISLACALNQDRVLGGELGRLQPTPAQASDVANAALLACLGSTEGHARTLQALTSHDDANVQMAQVYLRHRPLADAEEVRLVARNITRMSAPDAQVRALNTLAGHALIDRDSLHALARLFPVAKTVDVQRAIAGVLIRSDYQVLPRPELAQALRQSRLKSPNGDDMIDVLIRRLQAP
ncbi:MAG: hypothetical protein ABIO63_03160 [Casimicrobiaceae bacterium]